MYFPLSYVFLFVALWGVIGCGEQSTTSLKYPADSTKLTATPAKRTVSVSILPENPSAADCLQLTIKGTPATPRVLWQVNGIPVDESGTGQLCGAYKRGDRVTVAVGNAEAGGSATVVIGNSPPRVVNISASPKDLRSGTQLEVFPVAEDVDGDAVEFRYQWLINDEPDPFLTESVLPAERNRRGDKIQLLITPFDGTDEGPVYQSYAMSVPGSSPKIVSKPPASFETLEYSYQVKVKDPDNDQLTFSLDRPPQGMTITRSGKITWPLTGVQPGKYEVKILVRDPEGGEDRQEFVLTLGGLEARQ